MGRLFSKQGEYSMHMQDYISKGTRFVHINKTHPMPVDMDILKGIKEPPEEIEAVPQQIVHQIIEVKESEVHSDCATVRTKWAGGTFEGTVVYDDILLADYREPIMDFDSEDRITPPLEAGVAVKFVGDMDRTVTLHSVHGDMWTGRDEERALIVKKIESEDAIEVIDSVTGRTWTACGVDMKVIKFIPVHRRDIRDCFLPRHMYAEALEAGYLV
jgi:hypothetical protein